MNRDLKTTVTALVGVTVWVAGKYGLHVPPETQIQIVVVTMLLIGLFAKDGDAVADDDEPRLRGKR